MATGSLEDIRGAVDAHPLWYHTIELPNGIVTPGWFDLRPIVDRLPWPEVRGKRCLDVGTYDGFLAFELERRGASEVVATDIADHDQWDWPPATRGFAGDRLAELAGPEKGLGFRIAKAARDSSVEHRAVSVYDLDPDELGSFDVVVCGSLLLHLRDPLRALEAIRGVCGGLFLSAEAIDVRLTAMHPRLPLSRVFPDPESLHWSLPNAAGHRRMLEAAGFDLLRSTRPYCIHFGPRHPPPDTSLRGRARSALCQAATGGGTGVPHTASLCRPGV